MIGAFALIFIVSCFISPNFLTGYNLTIMARDLAFIGIVAIAQGLLLLLGDIDVSIGAIAGLCAVVCAKFLVDYNMNPVLAMAFGLGAGALMGCINGLLITAFNLNSLVLTIGTQTAFTGLNLLVTRGRTITGLPENVTFLGAGSLFQIPMPVYFLVGVFAVALFLATKTVFGRQVYAIGNSHEAARIVGIKEQKVRVIAYALAGVFAGLAGILIGIPVAVRPDRHRADVGPAFHRGSRHRRDRDDRGNRQHRRGPLRRRHHGRHRQHHCAGRRGCLLAAGVQWRDRRAGHHPGFAVTPLRQAEIGSP